MGAATSITNGQAYRVVGIIATIFANNLNARFNKLAKNTFNKMCIKIYVKQIIKLY